MATPVKISTKVPANAGRQVNRAAPISSAGKPVAKAGGPSGFTAGHRYPLLTPVKTDQRRTY